ncbi:unnamed protein product [Knipowitschia caucasica]
MKTCPAGHLQVRFQEYTSGFHNFNDRVLLTLPLCHLLLSALANKTAPGRMLSTITHFNDSHFHHQTVRKAFHHFMALVDFHFGFTCNQCGYYPPIMIADANWKLAFEIPVGTFRRPDLSNITRE